MNFNKYNGECPDVYREGGGGLLGGIVGDVLNTATLGLSSVLGLSKIDAPSMPTAPKGPKSMSTGLTVAEKGGKTLGDEEEDTLAKARKTARKGTTAYRIPLETTASGLGGTTSNSTGLGI